MNALVQLPASRADRTQTFVPPPFSTLIGGLTQGSPNPVVKSPTTNARDTPFVWHRGTLFNLGRLPTLPAEGVRGYTVPATDFAVYWDNNWGKAGTLVREPRLIEFVSAGNFPFLDLSSWLADVFESVFFHKHIAAFVGINVNQTGSFGYGLPLASNAAVEDQVFAQLGSQFEHATRPSAVTNPALYRGGEYLLIEFQENKASPYAAAKVTRNNLDDSITECSCVPFSAWAAEDLALANSGAKKFAKFRHVVFQQDKSADGFTGSNGFFANPIPDSLIVEQMGGSPYFARRLCTPDDEAAAKHAVLSEVADFWP